jgi:hypothetical protein
MMIRKHLSNMPGWRTKRKLIVFESDDWGSIRTRSKWDYTQMVNKGLNVDKSNFTKFDCLESNDDLERLFNVLTSYTDIKGNHPVFTPMCVVANPDFVKIADCNFDEYYYEPFTETCKKYPNHDNVINLWRKGIKENLFVPEFHGREHLNSLRWIRSLQQSNKGVLLSFNHGSIGGSEIYGEKIPQYLAAFDPEFPEDIEKFKDVLISGANLFNNLLGYFPRHFVASNKPEPKVLEETLHSIGIKSLIRYKFHVYPNGDGTTLKELNWLGKRNSFGQLILTRNCGFEPSDPSLSDWNASCMDDISTAFFWSKPAVISTHRVNYVGCLDQANADSGLKAIDGLLNSILKRWPDAEFITSTGLSEIISNNK